MQLTENFHRSEFRCRCRDRGLDIDDTWCLRRRVLHVLWVPKPSPPLAVTSHDST